MVQLPDPSAHVRETINPNVSTPMQDQSGQILAQGAEKLAAGVSNLGRGILQVAAYEKDKIDQSTARNAMNAFDQQKLNLTAGYSQVKGAAAVVTPEGGKPFVEDYSDKIQSARDKIAESMPEGRAKTMFLQNADQGILQFKAGLLSHLANQTSAYHDATYQNTVKLYHDQALATNDPAHVKAMVDDAIQAFKLTDAYAASGDEAPTADAIKNDLYGQMVKGQLSTGDYNGAMANLDALVKSGDIPPSGAIALRSNINEVRKVRIAEDSSNAVANAVRPLLTPTMGDRAFHIAIQATGAPPASPAAQAEAQTKFGNLVKQYNGDVEKAWAAYYTSPETVDNAVQTAENDRLRLRRRMFNMNVPEAPGAAEPNQDWRAHLPADTQKILAKNNSELSAGGGAMDMTAQHFEDLVVAKALHDNAHMTPDMIDAVKTKARARYAQMKADINDNEENAAQDIAQRIWGNEVQSLDQISPAERLAAGSKWGSVVATMNAQQGNADKIAEASPVATQTYLDFATNPEKLANTNVTTLLSLSNDIGRTRVGQLIALKQQYATNPDAKTAAKVDNDMFRNEAANMGFKGGSQSENLKLVALRDKVESVISNMRAQGQTVTDDVKRKVIREQATQVAVKNPGDWFSHTRPMYEVKPTDKLKIPDSARREILKRASAAGVTIPEDQMPAAYIAWQQENQYKQ